MQFNEIYKNFPQKILLPNKLITFLNPFSTYVLNEKNLLPEICNKFDYIFVDGILLVKLLEIKYKKKIERVSFDMTSLAPIVFEFAVKNKKSLFFIGTKEGIIEKSIKNIKSKYPDLNVVGYRHGYFINKKEYYSVVNKVKEINPDIVIAGMGTPLQELFLLDLRASGWNGTGFTCGGFLEQTANNINYYPYIFDKLNLRWLYRLYKEPKRLSKRYFYIYPKFLFIFLRNKISICEEKIFKLFEGNNEI